jgi:hypothetical protein
MLPARAQNLQKAGLLVLVLFGGALVPIALDATVPVKEVNFFNLTDFHEDPGRKRISAILGEDDVISEINAGVEGVTICCVQKEQNVTVAVGWINRIKFLKHGARGELGV